MSTTSTLVTDAHRATAHRVNRAETNEEGAEVIADNEARELEPWKTARNELLKTRDQLRAEVERATQLSANFYADMERALGDDRNSSHAVVTDILKIRAELATERARLDWLLEYITNNGSQGIQEIAWTVYDENGKSLMDRETIAEDEIGEIRFDRTAIDAAIKETTP